MLKWIITALVRDIKLKHIRKHKHYASICLLGYKFTTMYKYNNGYIILLFISTAVVINTVKI